ncbi:MAG: ParB/RepB/Spo0J family partition protein [Desulfobulbus sp.]|uniref:ParB/RepB/Spo0J family partition protein n=1 Tax=uncultured Desulfobulbus sp. TaxID=239745 RepID=UPI001B59E1C3|nr:ParB/RepB/Spo0J family partition protein [uncultured Desulfobulbus sp.]MBP7516209.1 ParB/RepB/Spo0J family partition protein [Desulfobulbus sp.]
MSTKNVLGRGVGALLPEDAAETEEKFFLCDIDKISANPHQPRSYFDEDKLQQLADSIREKGIIQPLLVTRGKGNRYTLVAGERRLRAASLAGLDEVPVVLMEETGANESLELALIENIQRHDLNPIEEAAAYARLMDEFQLTQEEVARKVGRQRSTVTNVLRLLALPSALQEDVARGRLTEGHARVLLRLKDQPERLQEVRDRIVNEELSVRAVERLCRQKPAGQAPARREAPSAAQSEELPPTYCAAVVNQLTNHLNAKVRLVQQGQRGRLEIEYYSSDDLDRLIGLLSP